MGGLLFKAETPDLKVNCVNTGLISSCCVKKKSSETSRTKSFNDDDDESGKTFKTKSSNGGEAPRAKSSNGKSVNKNKGLIMRFYGWAYKMKEVYTNEHIHNKWVNTHVWYGTEEECKKNVMRVLGGNLSNSTFSDITIYSVDVCVLDTKNVLKVI